MGTRQKGELRLPDNPIEVECQDGKEKKKTYTRYGITLDSQAHDYQKLCATVHELGHLFCGHVPPDKKNALISIPKRTDIAHNSKEMEAETVCKIVCDRFNLDYDYTDYMRGYLNEDGTMPEFSVEMTLRASDKMLKLL